MTTLKVTVGEADRIRSTARERIRAAERDEPLDDDEPVLNFESYATLAKFLRETNLELLETIRQEEPPSIREAASLVDRDYREVHRNLSELESLGLIRFEGGGAGIAKQPIVAYDDVNITISLVDGDGDTSAVTS
jgi:predicted transcriptional regulator